jgi:hypothetical protein
MSDINAQHLNKTSTIVKILSLEDVDLIKKGLISILINEDLSEIGEHIDRIEYLIENLHLNELETCTSLMASEMIKKGMFKNIDEVKEIFFEDI